jgi:hypothetical protein
MANKLSKPAKKLTSKTRVPKGITQSFQSLDALRGAMLPRPTIPASTRIFQGFPKGTLPDKK